MVCGHKKGEAEECMPRRDDGLSMSHADQLSLYGLVLQSKNKGALRGSLGPSPLFDLADLEGDASLIGREGSSQ